VSRPQLAGAALVAALAAGCSAHPAVAPGPRATAFAPGTCRAAAPALLGLHATASRVLRSRHPDLAAAADAVRRDQQVLRAQRPDPALAGPLRDVVVAAGFFRIRVDSRTYDKGLARSLDAAYDAVVRRCVSPPPGR
jgi:hypothetical protein